MKFARRSLPTTVIPAKAGTQYAAALVMGFGVACCTACFLLNYLCLLDPRLRGDDDQEEANLLQLSSTFFPGYEVAEAIHPHGLCPQVNCFTRFAGSQ